MADTPRADVMHVDLGKLADTQRGPGVVWSHASTDMNINLVVFPEGMGVRPHVNVEVDVLLMAIEGQGRVVVAGVDHVLVAGQALVVPKGARRQIEALSPRFAYLSCHRRRPALWPVNAPRPISEKAG